MDPTLVAEQPTGFIAWIMANGQIIAFFAQLFYWIAMVVLLAYAVVQYKRWVNYQMGVGKSGKLRTEGHAPSAEEQTAIAKPSVEQFVD